MKYVLNRKTTFSSCAIGKKEGSQKVGHYRAGGPSGDFQVEEERIIWQFYYFLAGCLCTSISLSSNLCEAITVPLCSGVLLIVGSYNLSPLTKQKGWLHLSSLTNQRSHSDSLDLSANQFVGILLSTVYISYYLHSQPPPQ